MPQQILYVPDRHASFFQRGSKGMAGVVRNDVVDAQFNAGAFKPFREVPFPPVCLEQFSIFMAENKFMLKRVGIRAFINKKGFLLLDIIASPSVKTRKNKVPIKYR